MLWPRHSLRPGALGFFDVATVSRVTTVFPPAASYVDCFCGCRTLFFAVIDYSCVPQMWSARTTVFVLSFFVFNISLVLAYVFPAPSPLTVSAPCSGVFLDGTPALYSRFTWNAVAGADRYYFWMGQSDNSSRWETFVGSVVAPSDRGWIGIPASAAPAGAVFVGAYALPPVGSLAPDSINWTNGVQVFWSDTSRCTENTRPSSLSSGLPSVEIVSSLVALAVLCLA